MLFLIFYDCLSKKSMLKSLFRLLMLSLLAISSFCFSADSVVSTTPNDVAQKLSNVDQTTPSAEKRLWNLQDADIRAVIAAVSQVTGKNFLVDPSVQGKITLISTSPIAPDQVYQMFLSALQVLGYQAIPTGNLIKIVPSTSARAQGAPIATNAEPGNGDETVVRVVNVQNVPVTQLVPLLRPLLPDWATLNAYPPSNSLVIAGNASNVNKLVDMINSMDQRAQSTTRVIHLQYANANQVNDVLTNLQNSERASGKISTVSFAADKNNNNIVLNGNPQELTTYLALLNQLDQRANQTTTQVFYLNYLKAKEFAPILAKIAGAKEITTASSSNTQASVGNTAASGQSGSTNSDENNNNASDDSSVIAGGSGNGVTIQAENSANAIIVNAPPTVMNNLRNVIAQLDHKPQQVLVEAIVAEIDQTALNQLGIQWGTIQEGASDITFSTESIATNFNQGVGIMKSESLRAIVNYLRTDTSADILSTPSVVVLDNQQASIEVGKDISIQNGSYANAGANAPGGAVSPFNTFDRQKVTLALKVTPQISPNNTVRLLIDQKNDSLENPSNPGPTPVINTAEVKTNVLISSGNILVLGGLINNDNQSQVQKVPFLGDIPFLGQLFRYNQKNVDKKSLMIFLRPIILQGGQTAQTATPQKVTAERYRYIREKQIENRLMENFNDYLNQKTTLPPYQQKSSQLPVPNYQLPDDTSY